ncbi:hypothetical protein ACWEOR_30625, partial [Micromonospora chalcea]
LLSVLPALFVLVGAVQLAPESVLRERGVAQQPPSPSPAPSGTAPSTACWPRSPPPAFSPPPRCAR